VDTTIIMQESGCKETGQLMCDDEVRQGSLEMGVNHKTLTATQNQSLEISWCARG
jgi:hypothetical protein